ncbi:MAG: RNA-guided pseudouridylation complex pseudouridine synthase subunit Cbf5 [Candidatus Nanoarchaeia archaeon]|nr:RNA-guided pseudouridylation complex pseudouridine synthase subunit Cbf5 [Candidatus Nanoarchaeia archaeon]MDD5740937.1 RNA-guided pseudouridylation complex pseudouridine synthase subunit Cbf5 [Candidatus Nanoarchaeia archaeon]
MINLSKIQSSKPIQELLEFCIINVDKPAGYTSFDVADKIRRIFGARKSGHFGTLDPMVTGVLPVALNRACKLSGYFMHKDKIYIGKMHIHKEINIEKLKEEMKKFIGKIKQMPPVKSAVKRQLRERRVNKFEILEINGKTADFIADVEAGTYIRKLVSDLGDKIGGAHMTELRRIKAGIFDIKNSSAVSNIENVLDKCKEGNEELLRDILIPAEIISEILPAYQIKPDNLKQVLTGKPLTKQDFIKIPKEEIFCAFLENRFIGVYRNVDEGDVLARAEFVLN